MRRSGSMELEAEALSDTDDSLKEVLAPELYWLKPLLKWMEQHVDRQALQKIRVISACSGTLAEATVLKDKCVRNNLFKAGLV